MSTLLVKERTLDLLTKAAMERNITVDHLLDELAEMLSESQEEKFQAARSYVRNRYKELYKRLA